MDNLPQGAVDQPEGQVEPDGQGQFGGDGTQGIGGDNGVQPQGKEGNAETLGPDNLPPELAEARTKLFQDYHEKTQKLATEKREIEGRLRDLSQSDTVLKRLLEENWFKDAYTREKGRRSGQVEDLTPEAFEQIKNDPKAFNDYVRKQAEAIAESKVGPELGKTKQQLQNLTTQREFEGIAAQYKDFKALNDRGAFDADLAKGYDYETAYARYKLRNGNDGSSIAQEAERILAARRAGSVDKPGSPVPRGQRVIKAKAGDLGGALDRLFEAHARGETNLKLESE